MRRPLLSIDPGRSGAMAEIYEGEVEAHAFKAITDSDLWELIRSAKTAHVETVAYIEKVGPMPTDGKASLAKFMQHVGMLRGFLIAAGIPFHEITPQKWQAALGLKKKKGESKPEHKRRMKQRAQELYPDQKVTLATADALLILEYGKQREWT